jgi:hypothetical protein
MRTVRESSKTRNARRVRVLRIAWGDTVEKKVKERVVHGQYAQGIVFWVLQGLLAQFRDVDAITERDVEAAVASACADWAGTPAMLIWEDFEQIYPDWDRRGDRETLFFAAEPVTRPIRG